VKRPAGLILILLQLSIVFSTTYLLWQEHAWHLWEQQHGWEEADHQWAREIQAWQERAFNGEAASAKAPSAVTPPPRPRDFSVEVPTPDQKTIDPLRKTQLAAAKRLEKELKGAKNKKLEPAGSSQKKKPSSKKTKKTKGKESEKGEAGKKRKASDGPMMKAMSEFVKEARAAGSSYKEALSAWKNSKEREAIVMSLPAHEVKRRRY